MHLVVKNGNFTFLLLELILADHVADLPPQQMHLVVKNGNFTFLLLELILAGYVADLPFSRGIQWSKYGNFKFLLLELILAEQLADLPPSRGIQWSKYGNYTFLLLELILADHIQWSRMGISHFYCQSSYWQEYVTDHSGQSIAISHFSLELILADMWQISPQQRHLVVKVWQFHISTVRAHIGKGFSTGRSTHQERHLVVKSQNSWLILAEQFYPTVETSWSRMAISHFYCQTLIQWSRSISTVHIGRTSRSSQAEASSGQRWQFHNSTLRAIGRTTGRSTLLVVKNGNFTFLLLELAYWQITEVSSGRSTPQQRHLVVKEWQFHISPLRAHIGSLMQIYPPSSSGQEWNLHFSLRALGSMADLPPSRGIQSQYGNFVLLFHIGSLKPTVVCSRVHYFKQLQRIRSYWQIMWQI